MVSILQPAEVVEIGIEKEKRRRDFYELCAEHFTAQKDLYDLFRRLYEWEIEHVRRFSAIRDTVTKSVHAESYEGETEAYMNALVASELYYNFTADRFASEIKTPLQALERAIGFEKDAILFFSGLMAFIDAKSQEVVQTLMEEEKKHILFLFNMKKRFAGR